MSRGSGAGKINETTLDIRMDESDAWSLRKGFSSLRPDAEAARMGFMT